MTALFIDGAPAAYEDLAHLALANYGAYTSFRVEGGGVRGLDLHLDRLARQAVELFGEAPAEARFRELIRGALDGRRDAFARVSLFSRHIAHRDASWVGEPSVMVGMFDPPPPLQGPLKVTLQAYAREAPELKHTATFGLMRARRRARADGFDDALFVGAGGDVSEGTLWNVGFWTGDHVVWPQAPMLAGVAQALVEQGLSHVGLSSETRPVSAYELGGFDGAFICNSATPACAVASIGEARYGADPQRIAALASAYAAAPVQAI